MSYEETLSFEKGTIFKSNDEMLVYWVVVSGSKNTKDLFNFNELTMYHNWGKYKKLLFDLVKRDTTLTLTIE